MNHRVSILIANLFDGQKWPAMWMETDPNAQKIFKYAQVNLVLFEDPWL
ncbi:MAG: hypothetical protein ACM3TT_05915 [Syntrophothermus sp.]